MKKLFYLNICLVFVSCLLPKKHQKQHHSTTEKPPNIKFYNGGFMQYYDPRTFSGYRAKEYEIVIDSIKIDSTKKSK